MWDRRRPAQPAPEPAADPRGPPVGTVEAIRLLTRDPTLAVLIFAVWSFLSGVSLVGPGDTFSIVPNYRVIAKLGISEEVWGAMMILDAVVLMRTTLRGGTAIRAAVTAVSGAFWLYFGAHVLAGGFEAGVLSIVGCWEVFAGLGLLVATVQWAGSGGLNGR